MTARPIALDLSTFTAFRCLVPLVIELNPSYWIQLARQIPDNFVKIGFYTVLEQVACLSEVLDYLNQGQVPPATILDWVPKQKGGFGNFVEKRKLAGCSDNISQILMAREIAKNSGIAHLCLFIATPGFSRRPERTAGMFFYAEFS